LSRGFPPSREVGAGATLVPGKRRGRASRANRRRRPLVQRFLDPAQRAAQGLGVSAGPAQGQRVLEFGSDGIRYGLQRFRCVSLHSAALHFARCAID
jgi:hypothetical protein